jgi:uncharacterized repeat protein (TIGR01451 family)
MTVSDSIGAKTRGGKTTLLLLALFFALLMGASSQEALACSAYGGEIDGFIDPVPPSQIQIDSNCTIRNFPASNPLTTNFSFYTQPGQNPERWLIIFDNVVHTGQMACNSVHGHMIWFTNGSSTAIQEGCQNLLIPVEKIEKENPAGQTTVTIGVPFTYTLRIPVLFDSATGTVINYSGSPNDLHGITVWDDLNETGVDLTYVSHIAYWLDDGTQVPHTFSNVGGSLLFDNFPIVDAGRQYVIELTVILEDTPANAPGTQFINTARWDFGRLIDGVYYEPLPGEWGISPPLTIAAPELVVTKSGPATMNLGEWGDFVIDVQNNGLSDAWDISIQDLFPDGPTGGMCDLTPEILSARVYASDGITPVPGKGPLNPGTDYSLSYSAAPDCRLDLTMLTPAGVIGPSERLIVRYRTQLDGDTQDWVALTNVAGAIQWFNGDDSNPDRLPYNRTLTNGTVGTPDHEDAHTVTAALTGFFFEKTVADLTSGVDPATTAAPGDTLRYTLRFRSIDQGLSNFRIFDELDALNAPPAFEPGTLTLVSYPAGADISGTSDTGGSAGTGVLDIRNLSLPVDGEVVIEFDITLASTLISGDVVTNQSTLYLDDGTLFALSDDPNVNGVADPAIPGDEDPTRVTIEAPELVVTKSGPPTMNLGQWGDFVIDVQNTGLSDAWDVSIRDLFPDGPTGGMCDLTPEILSARVYAADGVSTVPGKGPLNPGTDYSLSYSAAPDCRLDITMMTAAAAIGPNERLIVRYRTQLDTDTQDGVALTNVAGAIEWFNDDNGNPNRRTFTRTLTDGTVGTPDHEDAHTVNAALTSYFFEKTVADLTSGADPATTAAPGDTLRYTLRFQTAEALSDFRIFDELDALNAPPAFAPGTLTLVSYPAGADISGTSDTGGSAGTGVLDIRNLSLPADGELVIEFDITLVSTLASGDVVTNQSTLFLDSGAVFALSDDPNVNGPADPAIAGDEDPTRVTIVAPELVVTKSGPATMNLGQWGDFVIDVQNTGLSDAWDVSIRDLFPDGPTGGMCDLTPEILSARVYAADGVTPVPGKGPLNPGTDYSLSYSAAPDCRLDITMLTAAAAIGPSERLILRYRTQLDANTQDGVALTNVAGAIEWFNDDDGNPNRLTYTRTLTNGTVGTPDHEDAHTVNAALTSYFFEKTVADLTSGADPATTAAPGDTLRYTLRFQTAGALSDFRIFDELDALNAPPAFAPGTLNLVSYPAGADISGTSDTGGSAGTGVLDIRNLSLPAGGEAVIEFDITLVSTLVSGDVVTNQSTLYLDDGTLFALSDDPNVNGPADPTVAGDEDPTRVTIEAPELVVTKSGPPTMNLGQWGDFVIDVQNTGLSDAWDVSIRDLFPDGPTGGMCDLTPEILSARVYAADGVSTVPGKGPLNPGTDYSLSYSAAPDCRLDITMMTAAAAIGPNERLIVRYRTQLDANTQDGVALTNVAGAIEWFNDDNGNPNRRSFTRTLTDGTVGTPDHEDAHTVNAALTSYFFEKTVADLTSGADPATTAAPGDTLRYTLRFQTAEALSDFRIFDELDALNAPLAFEPGTLNLVSYPAGADISGTSDTGGSAGTGVLDIRNLSLPADGEAVIEFDITLVSTLTSGDVVTNQSTLYLDDGTVFALSDDPNVNGPADPAILGDEDPTRVTIVAPELVATKSGPATMNLGQWGDFVIDVQNTGLSDAWDVSIQDLFPDGPTGGMCDLTPEILSARVFAADGVSTVPGKGPLNPGTDYSLSYSAAPDCRLDITMMTAAAAIGPDERLILRYRTQLDADTQDGVALTNVAGAIEWFNDDDGNPNRLTYTRSLTDGTVGTPDHEDAHTVNAALTSYFFEKTVADLTSGADPATTAAPGDTLRYTLRFQTTEALSDFRIFDELDALNAPLAFEPGTLNLVGYPAGADISGTSGTGGSAGTGVLDIRNLSLPADGELVIEFDITLVSILANGTVVTNQSTLYLDDGAVFALSDDPNVNGPADPTVADDEDPTRVTIVSTPAFLVQKISTDLTGDPNVLLAGETLRYTITVKNIGTEDAVNVVLRDAVPANTTYVAGSTTLNGSVVADVSGLSPLVNGMLINSPADPTPGSMPADASSNPANVATLTFDVVVDPDVVDGTIISNQGFVSAVDNGIVDQPSDDPDTPIPDDPTIDIVGNFPVLYAEKSVVLFGDLGSPGIVDPGDVLRYTITVQNSAAIPATGVVLTDSVPANTTYVADSTLLNGLPVGQPDGGASPLASGIDISSSDLTPPLPGAGAGTISPGATAVLQFDLQVDAGTPAGTLISNQAVVQSVELPDLLTDGDGDPTTGPEPTVVVVGDVQQLSITKQVAVVGGGAAVPGAELEYTVRVLNIASVPALNVVITDDLDVPQPGQLIYVNPSATMNGSAAGVSFAGSTITGDYAATYGPLEPGGVIVFRFRATLDPGLLQGTVVTNTGVVAWNTPTETASASVSIVVGGVPGVSVLNGTAWHDADFDDALDSRERELAGWAVDLYQGGQLLHTTLTDASGVYRIIGVPPNDVSGLGYELRFTAPGAGANTAMLGLTASPFTNGMQRITDIIVPPDANLQGLNLPIDPNGVVYNSMARTPVAGATLTLLDAGSGSPLPASCFDDAAQQGQVTLADGYYKFDVNFSDSACPSGGDYLIDVAAPPGATYVTGYSQIIPPMSDPSTAAFSVPACPGSPDDAIPVTDLFCEVQPSETAPAASVPPLSAGTNHHVHVMLDSSRSPGSSQIFNNHIPLDPQLAGSVAISKTSPMLYVTRGQQVPYLITVNNVSGLLLSDVSIVDRIPAGFAYVEGSARLDGVPAEPSVTGLELRWDGLVIAGTETRTVQLLLVVGGGVTEGDYVNRAQVVDGVSGLAITGEATATVRIMPDPTFDCTDVIGKVFNDANRNGRQDRGEDGLPGVRVLTARGLEATTDQYGRFHITCAVVPHESRGSNFVMKLDDRTLPSGFRMSTDEVQVKRATRGKALRFSFGASIHRVVAIDLSDPAFERGATGIRVQWRPRVDLLLEELCKAPSVLRLSYVADTESAALVERRLEEFKRQLTEDWDEASCGYRLTIEPEIFWRLGAPRKQPDLRVQSGR